MAKITRINESAENSVSSAIIIPIPARTKKGSHVKHVSQVSGLLSKYQVARQRYKEMSENTKDFSPGEIYLFRDVNVSDIDIMNTEISADEISKRLEKGSKVIVLMPTKTRDDKQINDHVIMGGFRSLYNITKSDPEIYDQIKTISIPYFPEIDPLLEKINSLYEDLDINIFVCLDLW